MLGLVKYALLGCLLFALTLAVAYALTDVLSSDNALIVGLVTLLVAAAKMTDDAKKSKNLSL
ncbi:hypothetical protein [uncultured Campylobacter sp.]|uniref:hypothetical protein n=1 Tax=uncultured Campylobacter sp. TaxID=218934 RepID=UPI0028E4EC82|nr:hypothetical protein [uncultured Campylobacter sp.]